MSNSNLDLRPLPARLAFTWFSDAFGLWMRAPFKLLLLATATFLAELLIQIFVPMGVLLSKFIVPILAFGLLLGVGNLAQGRALRWPSLIAGFRGALFPRCALLAVWTMSVFAFQLLISVFVYGPAAIDMVLHPLALHPELATRAFTFVFILPGMIPATLLILSSPLMLFDGLTPTRAVASSIGRVLTTPAPFILVALTSAVILAVIFATSWTILLLLPFGAWNMALTYVIWKSVTAASQESIRQSTFAQG